MYICIYIYTNTFATTLSDRCSSMHRVEPAERDRSLSTSHCSGVCCSMCCSVCCGVCCCVCCSVLCSAFCIVYHFWQVSSTSQTRIRHSVLYCDDVFRNALSRVRVRDVELTVCCTVLMGVSCVVVCCTHQV